MHFTVQSVCPPIAMVKTPSATGSLNVKNVVKSMHVKEHACYTIRCQNCSRLRKVDHRCFIQPLSERLDEEQEEEEEVEAMAEEEETTPGKKKKPPPQIVAFDIECEAKEIEDRVDKVFEPVLIGWSMLGEVDDYHEVTTIAE